MNRSLIIFIGHHKVGSTSLQAHFAANYHRYTHVGILYPFVDAKGLELSQSGGDDLYKVKTDINVREPHNALAFRLLEESGNYHVPSFHKNLPSSDQMFLLIKNQISVFNPKVIVLISEVMSNFTQRGNKIVEKLAANFDVTNVYIYCVLRRPDEYLESWYGQRLKFKHKIAPISKNGLDGLLSTVHFDYVNLLKPWINVFGKDNIHLRYYRDILKQGGSVTAFRDFLNKQIGIAIPDNIESADNLNLSFHPANFEYIRRLIHDGKIDVNMNALAVNMANSFILRKILPPKNETEIIGPEMRRKLYDSFLPQKKWFDKTYPEELLFFDMDKILELRSNHLYNDDSLPFLSKFILTLERYLILKKVNRRRRAKEVFKRCRRSITGGLNPPK